MASYFEIRSTNIQSMRHNEECILLQGCAKKLVPGYEKRLKVRNNTSEQAAYLQILHDTGNDFEYTVQLMTICYIIRDPIVQQYLRDAKQRKQIRHARVVGRVEVWRRRHSKCRRQVA